MKRFFRYIIVACAATMALASCDNAEYSIVENGVYISEAALTDRFTQQVENQIVAEEVTKSLTIRLAAPIDEDVTVTLGLDQDFIDTYNQRNGTSYQMLPQESYSLDNQVTIPAGSISAPATLVIKPFSTPNGEAFALAVKIVDVNGPVEAISDATHILYLLQAPHKQKVPVLDSYSAANSRVTFKNAFSPATWTFEYWLRMGNDYDYDINYGRQYAFYDNSAPISIGECFLRWWATGALLKGPCYQNQMNGVYFDDNTEAWVTRTWYHIAYTFDGTTIQLYIDGQKNAYKETPGKAFTFGDIVLLQNWGSWYGQNTSLAQIRIWEGCLPQASIQDAMNREVPVDSPGLLGYWKCSEGEGNVLHDSTPNANHLTLRDTPRWDELGEVNFMYPNGK